MIIQAIVLCCAFLCSVRLYAQKNTDVIVMKNGDRFTCEIKGLSAGVLSVKLSYVDGTIGVQWSQIAHLESNRLFLVQTESGTVYTGKISTTGASNDPPIKIAIAAPPSSATNPRRAIVDIDIAPDFRRSRHVIEIPGSLSGFFRSLEAANCVIAAHVGGELPSYRDRPQLPKVTPGFIGTVSPSSLKAKVRPARISFTAWPLTVA